MSYIFHKPSKELLKAICRPECLIMGPVIGPSVGLKTPIHLTFRTLFSFPKTLDIVAKEMWKIINKLKVDCLAAIEMSGIPWATAITLKYKIPMVVVRKEKRKGARFSVEGITKKGWNYVLIDDVLSGGVQKKKAIEFINQTGGKVTDMIILMNVLELRKTKFDFNRNWLEKRKLKIHYYVTWLSWYKNMHKFGYLSNEMYRIIEDAIKNIVRWQKDREKWEWFKRVKKSQGGKFVQ